jgi:hypothetical protein
MFPCPSKVPRHDPEYQYQSEFVPKFPPLILKEVLAPSHKIYSEAEIETGLEERVLTRIELLAQAVVLHNPCALT